MAYLGVRKSKVDEVHDRVPEAVKSVIEVLGVCVIGLEALPPAALVLTIRIVTFLCEKKLS